MKVLSCLHSLVQRRRWPLYYTQVQAEKASVAVHISAHRLTAYLLSVVWNLFDRGSRPLICVQTMHVTSFPLLTDYFSYSTDLVWVELAE